MNAEGIDYMTASTSGLSSPICVSSMSIADGKWHDVRIERQGHNLVLEIDDGDGIKRNDSLVPLIMPEDVVNPPGKFEPNDQEGIVLGGVPEFVGIRVVTIHQDLKHCK